MHRPRSSPPIQQPADIDLTDNPHSPVVLEERNGVIVAKLGCVVVGMVCQDLGEHGRCWWACALPDTPRAPQYLYSIETAKERLTERVRDWIEAAGLCA